VPKLTNKFRPAKHWDFPNPGFANSLKRIAFCISYKIAGKQLLANFSLLGTTHSNFVDRTSSNAFTDYSDMEIGSAP